MLLLAGRVLDFRGQPLGTHPLPGIDGDQAGLGASAGGGRAAAWSQAPCGSSLSRHRARSAPRHGVSRGHGACRLDRDRRGPGATNAGAGAPDVIIDDDCQSYRLELRPEAAGRSCAASICGPHVCGICALCEGIVHGQNQRRIARRQDPTRPCAAGASEARRLDRRGSVPRCICRAGLRDGISGCPRNLEYLRKLFLENQLSTGNDMVDGRPGRSSGLSTTVTPPRPKPCGRCAPDTPRP